MRLFYLTLEQVKDIHRKTVEVSGGGSTEILDLGKLESVLIHIQNDDYYPSFEDKLTHLFFCVNKFHCFEDGNKRIAIALGAQFLLLNGYIFVVKRFIHEMENVSYHVASGDINKELLHEIITAVIYDDIDNEELKLKIFHAIGTNYMHLAE
ncbi:MAG: type II toxin-antitoxin system death-on-curing family toxin [Bacteroidetes bacterium]|nr:type II toxin-antitoxin system death-on-curing family toxin [Bacteroidota bacterium]MCB1193985.1 type II toxin-antitoxin system death-on-curing family toxin [Leptospiraceae bacterium]